jgi:hypothetical protein
LYDTATYIRSLSVSRFACPSLTLTLTTLLLIGLGSTASIICQERCILTHLFLWSKQDHRQNVPTIGHACLCRGWCISRSSVIASGLGLCSWYDSVSKVTALSRHAGVLDSHYAALSLSEHQAMPISNYHAQTVTKSKSCICKPTMKRSAMHGLLCYARESIPPLQPRRSTPVCTCTANQ